MYLGYTDGSYRHCRGKHYAAWAYRLIPPHRQWMTPIIQEACGKCHPETRGSDAAELAAMIELLLIVPEGETLTYYSDYGLSHRVCEGNPMADIPGLSGSKKRYLPYFNRVVEVIQQRRLVVIPHTISAHCKLEGDPHKINLRWCHNQATKVHRNTCKSKKLAA